MTAITAVLVGLFAGYRYGWRKGLKITLLAMAAVLVFQTIFLATADRGRAFEDGGLYVYPVVQLAIFGAGAGFTRVGSKLQQWRAARLH